MKNKSEPLVINFKDEMCFTEMEEHVKKVYHKNNLNAKITYLTEYYKFHKDIPRLFMVPTTIILNNFHDKKRRIEYFVIA